jgi:acetylornithine deacetylase/succinyl-diaminopimelate desuccinylase-like protein
VVAAFQQFVLERLPPGCRAEFQSFGTNPAVQVAAESPFLGAAERALEKTYGRKAVLIGSGGSIPAVGAIQRIIGAPALLVGFGLDDDCVHSPNEKFELACFHGAMRSHAAMLAEFGRMRV